MSLAIFDNKCLLLQRYEIPPFLQNDNCMSGKMSKFAHIKEESMNWVILILAGLCEVGFSFCLGKTKGVAGLPYWEWMAAFAFFYVLSAVLLAKAVESIPIGTAYPVWTGIGALGAVLLGIFVFHEPATFWRLFFITTLVGSIIGLKLVSE
jgi:quaternary ammonium compound-resistance protein SugE